MNDILRFNNSMILETILIVTSLVFWFLYSIGNFFLYFRYKRKAKEISSVKFSILRSILIASITFQLFWIILRISVSHHAPFSGAYESMLFFSLLYAIKIFFLSRWNNLTKAFLTLPILLLIIGALMLPLNLKLVDTLVPSLQSFWIYIHVPTVFIGYVSLVIGFVLIIIFFFQRIKIGTLSEESINLLNNEITLAFIFLTLGIITGAIWGEQAWGNFWSWDPKETMALVTWCFLTLYFHFKNFTVRFVIITLTFVAMLITYFGVMFFTSGLHSYV